MNTRIFTIKLITKIIIYAIISTIVFTLLENPIITNELMLGQMESNNELYLLMEIYLRSKPFISLIYGFITVLFAGTTIYDIYKFIKTETKENY